MKHSVTVERRKPVREKSRVRNEALLQAARELIVERGYQNVTTKHIAERAGVPIGSVYYLYPSKYAIYAKLGEEYAQRVTLLAMPTVPITPANWETEINALLERLRVFWWEERAFGIILEALGHIPELAAVDQASNKRLIEVCGQLLAPLLPEASPAKLHVIAHTLIHVGDRLLNESLQLQTKKDRIAAYTELTRVVMGYLRSHVESV